MAEVKRRSNLRVWRDVIFAIFLREIKSKTNDKLGIAWEVVSPVAFIFVLSFIRGKMDDGDTHGIPTFVFMVFGMILVKFFLVMIKPVLISKNKPLYAFRQVQPISSVVAIGLFELLVQLFVIVVIGVIIFFLRQEIQVNDPLEIMFIILRVWVIGISVGLVFSLGACFIPELTKIVALVTRPIFFISGIFFSLQDIPTQFWVYLTWNPLLHAVELARFAAYPQYGSAGVSDFYLNICTIVCLFFALACYQASWTQAISR